MKIVKLKDVARITTGKTPLTNNKSNFGGIIPFVKPPNLGNSTPVTQTAEYLSAQGAESVSVISKNSIMVCCIGSLGKVGIAGQDLATNQQINSLTFDSNLVDYKFGYYFALTLAKKLDQMAHSAVVPIVNKTAFSNLDFVLIPLEDQKRIVKILDEANALRQKRKQAIELLDDYLKSVFLEMFGDPVKNEKKIPLARLSKLGTWHSGGTPSRAIKEYFIGNIPWYSSGELNDIFIADSIEHISEKAIKETSAKLIPINSLLLGMYDTAALKSSISTIGASCNQAIAFSLLDEKLAKTVFVYYCIQYGKNHYKRNQRGVRQKNMNLSMIKSLEIPLPNINEQAIFVSVFNKVFTLKQKMLTQSEGLETQFQALIQKAFTGEL